MNYYEILGISEDATNLEIWNAYKRLSAEYAPSQMNGLDGPYKDIQEAWEVLKDDSKKAVYDETLRAQNTAHGFQPNFQHQQSNYTVHSEVLPSIRYGGFWIRVVAYIVDYIILTILVAIAGGVLLSPTETEEAWQILTLFIVWAYYTILESTNMQATFGKRLLGLKVVDYEYQKISFGKANGRLFSKIISGILLLGFIHIAFSPKKQGWHDEIAKCYVIYR